MKQADTMLLRFEEEKKQIKKKISVFGLKVRGFFHDSGLY
jgi:hypothetical protein